MATTSPSSTAFLISGGQIIGPNGQPFIAKGIAVLDSEISTTSAASIISLFPGINAINLAVGADGNGYATAQPNSALIAWVNDATSKGLAVTLSDYVPGQPQVRSGADLTASLNWYSSLAEAFANNPNVWWTTENQVGGNLGPSEQAIYNAIRGAGNNGLIFMEAQDGNATTTNGLDPSIYANMTGVGWNIHAYPWEFNTGSTNQADYDNTLKNYVSMFQTFAQSQDGVMPVLIGEGGNSTSGNNGPVDDPIVNGKFAVTQSILETAGVSGGTSGYLMWLHDWHGQGGDADTLVNISNNTLTDYGAQVDAAMSASPSSSPPPVPAPPPPTPPTTGGGTSNMTYITPGSGTFTDPAGNSYSIDAAENADENGGPIPGGGGTAAMDLFNGTVYAEDAGSGQWYTWNQSTWTPSVAPGNLPGSSSPPPTPAPTPTPAPAPSPPAALPVLTPTSGGSVKDGAGNTWTLTNGGVVEENSNAVPGGSGTSGLFFNTQTGEIEAQDASSQAWYSWNGAAWQPGGAAPSTSNTDPPPPKPSITVDTEFQPPVVISGSIVQNSADYGATIDLTAPGVASIVLGAEADSMEFAGMTAVKVTGGSGSSVLISDSGPNSFTVGAGAMTVTGGAGSDSYTFAAASGNLTIDDFSAAKGNTLTVAKSLQAAMTDTSDGNGGSILGFGSGTGIIHLVGIASSALPSSVRFV
jgi:hypothetical protein